MQTLPIDPLTAPPDATVPIPGSKSITNRALVAASLATGTSVLSGVLIAEDTMAMVDSLGALGVGIDVDREARTMTVHGTGGKLSGDAELYVRQSGTTARFVLPLAAITDGQVTVDGDPQIQGRPQGELVAALVDLGMRVESIGQPGHLPLRAPAPGAIGQSVKISGETSSQFISGLLLVAPVLSGGLTVELTGEVISAPYIDMTVAVMRTFGADVRVDGNLFSVAPGAYEAHDYRIEPDASAASYFFAAAAASGGRVAVEGLGASSIQGDTAFVSVLEAMGATVTQSPTRTEVVGPTTLRGIDVSMAHISDTAPTLGAIAPFASGPVTVRDVGFIRFKESDRIAGVVAELQRAGIEAQDNGDGFTVQPGTPAPAVFHSYDDHRMAMAFTVLGLLTPGTEIADPFCVAKTFPEFFDTVDALRAVADKELAIVALDGPAGSGKSTVAKLVADRLGLEYLDTGAMYRSVTLAALERDADLDNQAEVTQLARHIEIDVGREKVTLDGVDVTAAIRTEAVNAKVSKVSAYPNVRAAMRRQQRAWARRRGGGVLEGRDIGTVVFPEARLKVFVTASIEERARRRAAQTGEDLAEMIAAMSLRDDLDSNRADSPLAEAHDADVVDTTGMPIEAVVDQIVEMFGEH